jgi:RimJ/RimL family protein N-acetyltransferase
MFEFNLRTLTSSDLTASAALAAATSQRSALELEAAYARTLNSPETGYLVGAFANDDELIGFARAVFLSDSHVASPKPVPIGWYLLGVNVAFAHQRQGVASALTKARLDWLRIRTDRVFYAALPINDASVALHRPFGFEKIGDGFEMRPSIRNLLLFGARLNRAMTISN